MRWVNIGGAAFVGFLVLLTAGTARSAVSPGSAAKSRAERMRTRTPNVRVYMPGTALAFVVNRPDENGGYLLGAGGQELWWTRDGWKRPRRLLPREGGPTRGLQSPEFSPDGKRLLVRSLSGESAGLWVMELPDGKPTRLPWTAEPWDRIEWLGDSQTLLLQHYPKDYQRTVSLCDTRTGSSTPIRAISTPGSRHGWDQAADGRSLYYVRQDGALARIVRLSLPSQADKIIGNVRLGPMHWQEANIVDLSISPDGKLVLLTGLGGAVIARLDGKVLHKDEAMAEDPNWSPDGRYAA